MRFAPSEEQAQLQEVAQAFLAEHPSPAWETVVDEQGWHAIAIPEAYGGFGYGIMELSMVAQELGRSLAAVPLLPCAISASAIAAAGSEAQCARWLAPMATGARAFMAFDTRQIEVIPSGSSEWRLTGTVLAPGAAGAAFGLLVTAHGVFVVSREDLQIHPQPSLDPTRPVDRIQIDATCTEAQRLPSQAAAAALDRGLVLLAAEAVGAAEACLDESVSYAKLRTQFGKPIGTFQAIQHKCADMLLQVESARSATWYAAWAADQHADDLALAARTARAYAGDALFACAAENIQIHGGVGFTWEHSAHRYLRRARADRQLLMTPAACRAALAAHLLGEA